MKKAKQRAAKRPLRIRPAIPLIIGACIGIFLLMFAMANDTWVVINLPGIPWRKQPVHPIVEARLWGVILTCFLAGASFTGIVASIALLKKNRLLKTVSRRAKDLENDLQKVSRLVETTPASDQSDRDDKK